MSQNQAKPATEEEDVERSDAALQAPAASALVRFPVAGIGASAGGLDAFRKFFNHMPIDCGVAFVVVPHLAPNHESSMVDLLARYTAMPVIQAADDMTVQPDRVYVLPPNKYMEIAGGKLHLTGPVERGGLQTSIDLFLNSLAKDCGKSAIGIVLSGTCSHGTLGLKAIQVAGGTTIVQDPQSAEYDMMPASAVAAGVADHILPPERMSEALPRYARHSSAADDRNAQSAEALQVEPVLDLLRMHSEIDFRCYRKKTLFRRMRRRMNLDRIDRIPDYLAFLQGHPEEIERLVKDMLIAVTRFFRNGEAFRTLAAQAFSRIVEAKHSDESVRVWVPACATGEEAYSLAMLWIEYLETTRKSCGLRIFATDVGKESLDFGRRGCYPANIAAEVSDERLGRFFISGNDGSYQVNKQLRETITFAAQNLLVDPPFSKLDLISCRNLLIYLEPNIQQKLIELFHFSLRDGGYLYLGSSETIGPGCDRFEVISKKWRIYRRREPSRPERVYFPILPRSGRVAPVKHGTDPLDASPGHASNEQLESELTAARGELRHTLGELKGSNEDLKASNEEMTSMNEELQAANEELETSKEEMQSLNAELGAVNHRLEEKIEQLRSTAEHLRRLATVLIDSNDAVTVHDLQGNITAWNLGATRMLGYSESEALQMKIEQLLPGEFHRDTDGLLARLRRGERVDSLEIRWQARDGRILDVWLTGTPLKDDAGRIVAVAMTGHDVTARKAMEREVLAIAADEQRRIGHDLHDTAGQELTALGLMADSLMASLVEHAPSEVPLAAKIVRGVRRTLGHVRGLSRGLVPVEVSAHGLMAALIDLTARIDGESGVACTFDCEEPVLVEDNTTATHLYRIAQEAVGNALKHGRAKHIAVGLGSVDELLTLSIADDGIGMGDRSAKPEGLGLGIMHYRADLIRAALSIESSTPTGIRVTCTLRENLHHDPK